MVALHLVQRIFHRCRIHNKIQTLAQVPADMPDMFGNFGSCSLQTEPQVDRLSSLCSPQL